MSFNTKRQKASWFVWRSPTDCGVNAGAWPHIQNKVFLVKASHAKLLTVIVLYTLSLREKAGVLASCPRVLQPLVSCYIWNETRVVFIFLLFNCLASTKRLISL